MTSAQPLVDYETIRGGDNTAAHRLYEQLVGLWAPAVVEAANDLGVFAELANGPAGHTGLAAALGTDERATRVLLDALYAYGILDRRGTAREGHTYALAGSFVACLVGEGTLSLQGKLLYDRSVAWPAWQRLSETVRHGTHQSQGGEQQNQIHEEDYTQLAGGISFWAPPIVDLLDAALREHGWGDGAQRSVLDVGCGTGIYSHLLLQRFAGTTATGLDAPSIAKIALSEAEARGIGDRFGVDICDFCADPWPSAQDLVLFVNIFHLQPVAIAQRLMASAAGALTDDGLVCIVDQIRHDEAERDRPQDRFALLFAASMLATGGGDTYRLSTYDRWLRSVGLRRVDIIDAPMHRILLAKRA